MYQKSVAPRQKETGLFVKRLTLTHFRNYPFLRLDIPASARRVVLTGQNGVGKTNLLESLSLLSAGKGLRFSKFSEMVSFGQNQFHIAGMLFSRGIDIDLSTTYSTSNTSEKREIFINQVPCSSQADVCDVSSLVFITPAYDRLFSGEPTHRRRFLDRLTQSFSPFHAKNCSAYQNAFRQWCRLIREQNAEVSWISALEETLGTYGSHMAIARDKTIRLLNDHMRETTTAFPKPFLFLNKTLEEQTKDAIIRQFSTSRASFLTKGSVDCVHSVDLKAEYTEKSTLADLCSTGEQKALLISVLLSYIKAVQSAKGQLPLILLDEITAHLDEDRRAALFLEMDSFNTQVFMTGTEAHLFSELSDQAYFIDINTCLNTQAKAS